MKKISVYLMLFLFLFSGITCKKDNGDDNEIKSDFIVMSNGTDPLIATCTKDGSVIDFYGQRNNDGIPLNVDNVIIKNTSDTTIYNLDNLGRPTKILSQNGTQFEFNWISSQKAVLTILSKDGQTQINTEIDFANGSTKKYQLKKSSSMRNGRPLKLNFFSPTNINLKGLNTNGNCMINVNSCGGVTDAEVMLFVKDKSGKTLGSYPTVRIEKGKYSASIPTNLAPTLNPSEICNSVVSVLDNACILNDMPGIPMYLCSSISAALAATGIAAPVAAAIAASCATVTAGMELYCSTLGYSPVPGAPSLAEQICNAQVLNKTFAEDIIICARANAIPYNSYSQFVTVSGNGPFPNLIIELSSETAIRTLTLNPSSPIAEQDYIAECNVFCLKAGTTVKLSIVGSDDYTDSITYDITSTQPEGIFSLTVPGAEKGVNDVITLEIILPNGTFMKRTASLVFG
jgi:hypothetical protein